MSKTELRLFSFILFLFFIFSGDPDIWDAVKNKILVWGSVTDNATHVDIQIGNSENANEDA